MTDPAPVLDLMEAFRRSKTMFAATALGVFDHLERGAASAADLAPRLGVNPGALERLLDACVSLGLLARNQSTYENTPAAAEYICRSSPRSVAGYILYSNQVLFPMWAHLEDAVREGSHRWRQAFGLEGPIFNHFFRSEEAMRTFLMGMHGLGVLSSPKVASAFDLSPFRKLVDLGGATGHLAVAACERFPLLRAEVFDFEPVIAFAREQVALSPARGRIGFIAGDFFAGELPEADLFAVGRILHDWSEDKIRILLRKVYERLPAGGALLIAEKLLDDDKTAPVHAHMQSLNMLICTEGRERSLGEYRVLLEAAGFRRVEGKRTGAPLDAVLAWR